MIMGAFLTFMKMGWFRQKWTSNVRMDGKTAIITGCNTGIGKYNAFDFYRRGCKVIMACRNIEKAEEAKKDIENQLKNEENLGSLVVEKLDLSSLKSVREFAQQILKTIPEINILVNNAGVMACPKMQTEDGFELQFGTNHLGHFLLTLLLLPRIIHSAPSKIINLSSMAHAYGTIDFDDINRDKSYSPTGAYAQSKLANVLFTKELCRRLGDRQVNVYAVHPGIVKTELGRHLGSWLFPGFQKIYRAIGGYLMKTAEEGAMTQIYCALDEKANEETGLYYKDCAEATPSNKATNLETAKKLWDLSSEMVNLGDFDPFAEEGKGNAVVVKSLEEDK